MSTLTESEPFIVSLTRPPARLFFCPLFSCCFFFSSRRRHTRFKCDWSSDVCSSDLTIDVSLSGILVKAGRTLAKGSSVHVSLDLSPRMKPVVGAGSVVRVFGGNQMGDRKSVV